MTDTPNTPTLRLLSLGAGVQSTTLAILAAEGAIDPLDGAIFSDTGWEPAAVYAHLDRLEQQILKPAGIPLHRVNNGNLREDALNPNRMRNIPAYTAGTEERRDPIAFRPCDCGWNDAQQNETWINAFLAASYEGETLTADAATLPEDCDICGNSGVVVTEWGEPYEVPVLGMQKRRCTQLYKLNPILTQTRLLLGASVGEAYPCRFCNGSGERYAPWRVKLGEYEMATCSVCDGEGELSRIGQPPAGLWAQTWVGFSTDEITRVSDRADTRYSRSRHPLLELGMSRTQCESFLRSRGWGSVVKSACKGCPFRGNAEWRRLRATDPGSWVDAVDFDHAYRVGPGMRHQRFLHISRMPLDQAPIERVQRGEWQQGSVLDAIYDAQLAEDGDPDGCSPYACRSGHAVGLGEAA